MLAYDMNKILRIVPEAVNLIKEASLSEEFPTDSKASALASGLRVEYLTKVAGQHVDYGTQEAVMKAMTAYGVVGAFEKAASRISNYAEAEKRASLYNEDESVALQQEVLRGSLGFDQDLTKTASYAEDLYSRASDKADETTLRYSSAMALNADSLDNALQKRAYVTGDSRYMDILNVVKEVGVDTLNLGSREKRASVARTITGLDKELHYNGDIYREAFVKQASYSIKLKSKSIPYESLDKGKVGDILGKDVANSLTGDYSNDKAVIESLPLDEKSALERFF